jgi:hypothetical protein
MHNNIMTRADQIVVHLLKYVPAWDDYVQPFESSQEGIGKAIGISRAHAAITLDALMTDKMVERALHHVVDKHPRCYSYRLTQLGIMRAKTIVKSGLADPPRNQIEHVSWADVLDLRKRVDALERAKT